MDNSQAVTDEHWTTSHRKMAWHCEHHVEDQQHQVPTSCPVPFKSNLHHNSDECAPLVPDLNVQQYALDKGEPKNVQNFQVLELSATTPTICLPYLNYFNRREQNHHSDYYRGVSHASIVQVDAYLRTIQWPDLSIAVLLLPSRVIHSAQFIWTPAWMVAGCLAMTNLIKSRLGRCGCVL